MNQREYPPRTRLVNLRYDLHFDVYIGRKAAWDRACGTRTTEGCDGYFGNPSSDPDRDVAIEHFKLYFHNRIKKDPAFRQRILDLRGKTLACWCQPLKCHGDVIIDWLAVNAS